MRGLMTIKIAKQGRAIASGKQRIREFCKVILNLNKSALDLSGEANKLDQKLDVFRKWAMDIPINVGRSDCLSSLMSFPVTTLEKTSGFNEDKENNINLGYLPLTCIQKIVSYFTYDRVSQLRVVCKSFNEACTKRLNEGLESLKYQLEKFIEYHRLIDQLQPIPKFETRFTRVNVFRDIVALLMVCSDRYKWHSGNKYCFVAGKVLDEARHLFLGLTFRLGLHYLDQFDETYVCRPHYFLFPLKAMVREADIHFRDNIVPKYLGVTQKRKYIPEFVTSGDVIRRSWKNENRLRLQEMEKVVEEQRVTLAEQKENIKRYVKIFFSLKKNLRVLNKKAFEKKNQLIECKEKFSNALPMN